MSLAHSSLNPNEVFIALQDAKNFEVENPTPELPQAVMLQTETLPSDAESIAQNLLPLKFALQPFINQNDKQDEVNFDLMEIISEVNNEDLMLSAMQMETEYQSHKSTSKTAVIKKQEAPPEMAASPFVHCRIGSIGTININIFTSTNCSNALAY